MANSREQEFHDDCENQEITGGGDLKYSSSSSYSLSVTVGSGSTPTVEENMVADLLSDREDRVLQWLHALDVQLFGACRADERLKPLLKSNSTGGVAEDRLLAHLNQHFEPSEVGMLARCFCIPLVSIRVGKIDKQGTRFSPTPSRGNLNLMFLPSSELRLIFIGDDGITEQLFTVGTESHSPAVSIEGIPADSSGRSFHIKVSDGTNFYFWCSEKSKLLGIELLVKMKDILETKPSIAELSGIDKMRLDCFVSHLHAYLVGTNVRESPTCSFNNGYTSDTATVSTKSLRSRHIGNQASKANSPYQGSLSPRSSSFKEGQPRSFFSLRNATKDKLRRHSDGLLSAVDNLMAVQVQTGDASGSNQSEDDKVPEIKNCSLEPPSFLESLGKLGVPASHEPFRGQPFFSPHYCWCPQGASTSQYPLVTSHLPASSIEPLSLSPLSSLLSTTRSSTLLTPSISLGLSDFPPLDFPALLPESLVWLPLSCSQQIPTFTPLMCDPIVHIPVIDFCSSGQGYLVSAGPAIQSTLPPLLPRVNPLVAETESAVEKGARETLRLLISSSSQPKSPLIDVLPAVLSNNRGKPTIIAAGSRCLYTGTGAVDAVATMGLFSIGGDRDRLYSRADNDADVDISAETETFEQDGPICLGASSAEDEGSPLSRTREERMD